MRAEELNEGLNPQNLYIFVRPWNGGWWYPPHSWFMCTVQCKI